MGEKWCTFENLTIWKHKTNPKFYVLAYVKCAYLFQSVGLDP